MKFVPRKSILRLASLIGITLNLLIATYFLFQQQFYLRHVIIQSGWKKSLLSPFNVLPVHHACPIQKEVLPHRTHLISRKRCTQNVFLLIVVFSAPVNFERRTVIRKTYATDPSVKLRWKTVFLLGQAANNRTLNEYLEAEEEMYRDLIRGTQKDTYDNLTRKTQIGLEWAAKYCDFHFLLKADDDVFINPYKLVDYLRKFNTPQTKLYMGRCKHASNAKRKGKIGVTRKEYNKSTYPDFCTGPAYVLSSDLVCRLVELFEVIKFFKLEDVYIGMLVEKIGGVKTVEHPGFRTMEYSCHHYPGAIAHHRASRKCIEKLFNETMKERVQAEYKLKYSLQQAKST